jgi:hypothetical protein
VIYFLANYFLADLFLANGSHIRAASDGDPMLLSIPHLVLHSRAFAGRRINRHDVADVDRRILLNAAALRVSLRRSNMLPDAVDAFDHHAVAARQYAEHTPGLALVGARYHHDLIA